MVQDGCDHHRRRRTVEPGLSAVARHQILTTVLRGLAVLLILRVLIMILANYADYFPPNFDSLFLQGREATFTGAYRPAFYAHIFSGPLVLLGGLILLSETVRRRYGRLHRVLGRVQVAVLLLFVLPSSVVMSRHAFGGWLAGLSFLLLSAATASYLSRRYPQSPVSNRMFPATGGGVLISSPFVDVNGSVNVGQVYMLFGNDLIFEDGFDGN